jgi:thiol-disulfide isomerase/thioredoxin
MEVAIVDTLVKPDGSIQLDLKNHNMDYIHLAINQQNIDLFLLPGSVDTLTFLENDSIVFSGDLSPINSFLFQNVKAKLSFNQLNHVTAMATHGEKDFIRFNEVNDSVSIVQLNNLELKRSQLPNWYVDLEKERLHYSAVANKLNSISYRKHMLKFEDDLPADFLEDLVNSVPLENEKFIGESRYMLFLHEYTNLKNWEKYETMVKVERSEKPISIYMAQEIDELFTGNVKDAFLTYRLSMLLESSRSEYDSTVLEYFSDNQMRNFMEEYFYSSVALKPGSKMPYFYLVNEKGEDVESNDYLGNIVLINFWADWCKPCIEEFPHENALVEKYKGKPVIIININIESKPERWKEYISKYGLKMDNLYANEIWTKNLKTKYNIMGIPHSVLLDWNGNVIENKTKTASRGVDELIDELLRKMEL